MRSMRGGWGGIFSMSHKSPMLLTQQPQEGFDLAYRIGNMWGDP
jgi:hypothetical protein